jgi:tetratricopeptide (TPR) repeat protein
MNRSPFVASFAISSLGVVLLVTAPALTHGMDSSPPGWSSSSRADDGLAPARKAIAAADWEGAIRLLDEQKDRQPANADVFNLLGYAERQRGNLDAAFAWYDKALALNPKHRGAHEYVGEAWLMAGNLPKAEEHLAALDRLCFLPCKEYRELKKEIAAYKKAHAAPGS